MSDIPKRNGCPVCTGIRREATELCATNKGFVMTCDNSRCKEKAFIFDARILNGGNAH